MASRLREKEECEGAQGTQRTLSQNGTALDLGVRFRLDILAEYKGDGLFLHHDIPWAGSSDESG